MTYQLRPFREKHSRGHRQADWYRLLNEPGRRESSARRPRRGRRDQTALRLLGLAITDQFTGAASDRRAEAEATFQSLQDPYERLYYAGIVRERFAKAQLSAGRPPHTLIVLFEDALKWFEEAEKVRPTGNDESILRWNRCVRILEKLAVPDRDREHAHFEPTDSPPV